MCYSDYIVSPEKLQILIRDAAKIDQLCVALRTQIRSGWPEKQFDLLIDLRVFHPFCVFYPFCDELAVEGDKF